MRCMKGYRGPAAGIAGLLALLAAPMAAAADPSFETSFKEVSESSLGVYAIYSITNTGERDIDDVQLSLWLKDGAGNVIGSMATGEKVPGSLWLAAGATRAVAVSIDRYPQARAILESDPDQAELEVDVQNVTYMSGD